MAEMDRFEARLAASLQRLADEVPTAVDASELSAAIATAGRDRSWPWIHAGAPAVRVALVLAGIMGLVYGMLALAPRVPTPFEPLSHGSMTCAGAPSTLASGRVTLECVAALPDPRLAGEVVITLGIAADAGGTAVRPGTIELDGTDATWRGTVQMSLAPNGIAVGDAVLEGTAGAADGLVLQLHLVSHGGSEWGLLGRVEAPR